ncbi:voltage-dependent L-type calcium channel subunit alpha-1D-like [Astyanax mexicanus]|uniref:voltage-dependent L-type calcium channel subunit alpha-1D-like n=1 Tax=Astyanax mexicanus TaxID=7994 RepID=UPI0020CB66C8|nr:voltage-dependent L-type calcium channel subunit alpha-1D-like [Astyanax mexicanus]
MDPAAKDGAAMGVVGDLNKSDTLNSTGSAGGRKRTGGAKKQMQANKSKLRAPRALCCLTLSNPIRMAALALVEWKYPSCSAANFNPCLSQKV